MTTVILNVTHNGESRDLPDRLPLDTPDSDVRRVAVEVLALPPGTFDDFVVDRFPETGRLFLRPKVPFGAEKQERTEREKASLLRAYSFLRRHRIPVPFGPAGDRLLRRAQERLAEVDAVARAS